MYGRLYQLLVVLRLLWLWFWLRQRLLGLYRLML